MAVKQGALKVFSWDGKDHLFYMLLTSMTKVNGAVAAAAHANVEINDQIIKTIVRVQHYENDTSAE